MENSRLLKAAYALVKAMDETVDSCTPQDIADIVKFHSKGAAAAAVASGWIPGAGAVAAVTISAGFIWSMYGKINSKLGIPFAENILKSLASGIATNLAAGLLSTVVINTALSFIPGLGSAAASGLSGVVCYALTLGSGIVYLKILTKLAHDKVDPSTVSAETLKNMAQTMAEDENIKEIYAETKKSYKAEGKE